MEEFGEVVAEEFPFDEDVGGVVDALGLFGDVRSESVFDDGDDLFGRWVGAGGGDVAAVAEGFEVRDFAGGVEGGEFGEGFGEGNVEWVEVFFGRGNWFV